MSDTPQMYMQTANEAQLLILEKTGVTTYKYETRGRGTSSFLISRND